MNELSNRTRNLISILGLVQGLLLLAAHVVVARGLLRAPADLVWLVPWWGAGIGVLTALQLVVTDAYRRRVWRFGLVLFIALAATGAYAGYRVDPSTNVNLFAEVLPFVLTAFIGWYVLLPFAQAYFKTGSLRPAYPVLFEFAWNNGITLLIATIFTGIFWALLALWAGLFRTIGIELFDVIFYSKYFGYPVTGTVFAFAVYLGRSHVSAVVTVRRVILAVFKGLLPLLAVIALLFLAALPFMGLAPLWATGKATALMLTLQAVLLFFLNAVFQNGQGEPPYAPWLRAPVRAAIVLLPIYTLLCAYALYLRVDQYGWSTDRFWAVLLTGVIALHVFGYAFAALRRSAVWMAGMAPVNVAIAAVVVALSVAVNSPLLDAQRIGAKSQVARLLDGSVPAGEFDYAYLRFHLGRAGNSELAKLRAIDDHPHAETIRASADRALKLENRYNTAMERIETAAQAANNFAAYPRTESLSESFLDYAMSKNADWQLKRCLEVGQRCLVLAIDLNGDKRKDYVVFRIAGDYDRYTGVYAQLDKEWDLVGTLSGNERQKIEALKRILDANDYAPAASPWQNLKIGKDVQRFRPQ